jgi:hypothetical protein
MRLTIHDHGYSDILDNFLFIGEILFLFKLKVSKKRRSKASVAMQTEVQTIYLYGHVHDQC